MEDTKKFVFAVVVEATNVAQAESVISAHLHPKNTPSFPFTYTVYVSGDPTVSS